MNGFIKQYSSLEMRSEMDLHIDYSILVSKSASRSLFSYIIPGDIESTGPKSHITAHYLTKLTKKGAVILRLAPNTGDFTLKWV